MTQSLGFNATTYTDGVSGEISINGATLSNVGTYTMTLTADVDNQSFSTSFQIIIESSCLDSTTSACVAEGKTINPTTCVCEMTGGICSLSFITPPSSTTIRIGIDVQPFTILFETTSFNCIEIQSFSWTSKPTLGFDAIITNEVGDKSAISISKATLSNVGSYELILTAYVDNQSFSTSFQITIEGSCLT